MLTSQASASSFRRYVACRGMHVPERVHEGQKVEGFGHDVGEAYRQRAPPTVRLGVCVDRDRGNAPEQTRQSPDKRHELHAVPLRHLHIAKKAHAGATRRPSVKWSRGHSNGPITASWLASAGLVAASRHRSDGWTL